MLNPATSPTLQRLQVDDARIEYEVHGSGEPVLLIHLLGIADGLGRPLIGQPELASHYRLIHYHRRGYAGSTLGSQPLTIGLATADAAALLTHLGVKSAHIVGHSIGGLIALQLALARPDLVHSIALLDPPLPVPSAKAGFERIFPPVRQAYGAGDKAKALDIFSTAVAGPNWQSIVEGAVPGAVEQAVKDVDTVMRELPIVQAWQFGPKEASAIRKPVLSVIGVNSPEFQLEGRQLLHTWFPQTEDLDVKAELLVQMQDPEGVAHGLAEFFARHPMR